MEKVCTSCGNKFETENEEDVLCQSCLEKKIERDQDSEAARKAGYLTKKEIEEGKVETQRINYLLKRERSEQDKLKTKIADLEKDKEKREEAELTELERAKKENERLTKEIEKSEADKQKLEHRNLVHSVLMKTKHNLKGLYLDKVDGEDEAEIVQNIRKLEDEQKELVKEIQGGGKEESPEDVNPPKGGKKEKKNIGKEKAKEKFGDLEEKQEKIKGELGYSG